MNVGAAHRWRPRVPAVLRDGPVVRRELTAGMAVWAAAVPSGLAYAGLAGLPPVTGLYASAIAGLAYVLLGTVRQAQVGPTSTSSILTAAAIAPLVHQEPGNAPALAAMLALEVALLLVLARALRLAFLGDLLSRSVLVGFTAAISLVIIAAQLPNLLGLTGVSTRTFGDNLAGLADGAAQIDLDSLALGVGALAVLLVLRRLRPRWPRELLVVIVATAAVSALGLAGDVRVVGDVPGGLPVPQIPAVSWADITGLFPAAAAIALIAFTETLAVGRTMGRRRGYRPESKRELLALGAANAAAGLVQGYPANASFAQTALSDGAGGRTPLTAVVTKVAILATLVVLTPLFTDVPYSVLAAVVIAAVLGFIDVQAFRRLLQFQRVAQHSTGQPGRWVPRHPEFWSALATFAGTLMFGILDGIVIGVVVTLLAVLFRASRPRVSVLGKVPGARRHRDVARHPEAKTWDKVLIVRFEAELFFANAEYFSQTIEELVAAHDPPPEALVLVCDSINHIDLTGMDALSDLVSELHGAGVAVRLCRVKGPVHDALAGFGLVELIGPENFFDSVKAAKKGVKQDGLPMLVGDDDAEEEHDVTDVLRAALERVRPVARFGPHP